MLVDFSHRLIFIKTKKTAGTSLEEALQHSLFAGEPVHSGRMKIYRDGFTVGRGVGSYSSQGAALWRPRMALIPLLALAHRNRLNMHYLRNLRDHSTPQAVRRCLGESRFGEFTKVTSVRNPFDLMVSAYFYETRKSPNPPSFPSWVTKEGRQRVNGTIVPSIDSSWRILRFENLHDDFSKALTEFGVEWDGPLPHTKGEFRPPEAKEYRELYDARSKTHVEHLYADWIELFGYKW